VATITPTAASANTSITPAAASAGGDTVATGSGHCTLYVVNASGGSINVTLAATQGCNIANQLHNLVVACAAGKTTPIFLPYYVEDASGNVAVTYSAVTSVTVYAVND
jgi:hypothetical protein